MAFTTYSKENEHLILFDWDGLNQFARVLNMNGNIGKQFWHVLRWTLVWAVFATFTCYFGGILLGIIPFMFISFTIGITGLPTPMNNLAVPLSLALVTFILIHYTSVRYTKWHYFKRFVDPIPLFLPMNLMSMWAPLLSMTLRMFGNAIVGWVLISLINASLESV